MELKDFEDSLGIDEETFDDYINAVDEYNEPDIIKLQSIFYEAVESGDIKRAKELLDAEVDIHDSHDWALRLALMNENAEMSLFLIENGASLHEALKYLRINTY